jgi:hypothetical protein
LISNEKFKKQNKTNDEREEEETIQDHKEDFKK